MTSQSPAERRTSARVATSSEKPVYLQTEFGGAPVDLFVEDLSLGGAGLICPEDTQALAPGQNLEHCTLVLPNVGRIPLQAVICWRFWPKVGVKFEGLNDNGRQQISQFLQASSLQPPV